MCSAMSSSTLITNAAESHDNPSRPSQKRSRFTRASRACEECRKRRVKCDSTKPRCGTCSHFDRRCERRSSSRKRGLPTGYVKAIECLLGQMMQFPDHGRDITKGILHPSSADATLVVDSPSPSEVWRQSSAFQHLESLLETEEEELDLEGLKLGLRDASMHAKKPPYLASSIACHDMARREGGKPCSHPDDLLGIPRSIRSGLVAQVYNLPENWPSLVDLYMSGTGLCFPVIAERDVVRLAQQICSSSNRVLRRENGDASGDHAALLAVLAYASYQHELRYPWDLGHAPTPTVKMSTRLQLEAEAMAMDTDRRRDLGHVQALAVLALLEMGSGSLNKAWEFLGEATSTALALGLVGGTTRDSVPDFRSSLLIHGLLALETMIAFRLGTLPTLRPQHLPRIEWLALIETKASFDGVRQPQPGPSNELNTFRYLVQVLCILNNRLHASGDRSTRDREALSELRTWFAALPPDYQRISISPTFQASSTVPQESLNLCLCATGVYLMLQVSSLVSGHCAVGVPQRLPATCSLLPALLARVQQERLVALYPMVDTYMEFLGYQSLPSCLGESNGYCEEIQSFVDILNNLSIGWHDIRLAS